ncbi:MULTISPECIES: hypothetical protein [unclassified Microbacterium]|uniref:hypothetical protein n=1 Tax=unclassified Microbacterium TaxID=2609290 RepID=UPI002883342E|nr:MULTISPECIES: hypothetical protein [unclassified Microbacterium]
MTDTTPRETRTIITTAQVRAQDLRDDDFILIDNQWRAAFDVHFASDSVIKMVAAGDADQTAMRAEMAGVRLDAYQDGADGRHIQSHISRPGVRPALFLSSRTTVAVRTSSGESGMQPMPTTSAVAALLETNEYIAVRWVRDEASDGNQTEDAWAVFRRWDLVTIQFEEEVAA